MMTRMFVSAALAAAALFSATPAAAAAEGDTFLVFIPYGDLDLATEAGEQELQRRLDAAARATCETGSTLREKISAKACRVTFARAGQPRIAQARLASERGVQLASR